MNNSKFSLADLLTVLAVIVFGFVSFLGANFLSIKNAEVMGMNRVTGCLVIAIIIAFVLFVLAYGAKLFKRADHNFKTNFIIEMAFLFLFLVSAMILSFSSKSPFTHYFTVSAEKRNIQQNLKNSFDQVKNMFAEYESYANKREQAYKKTLELAYDSKTINPNEYNKYFNDGINVDRDEQISTKTGSLHRDLFPTNYSDPINKNGIKEIAIIYVNENMIYTNSWKPIGIVDAVRKMVPEIEGYRTTLTNLAKKRQPNEEYIDFEYNLRIAGITDYFTNTSNANITSKLLAIGLSLLAYVLMILSWYVTPRSPRFPGLKLLFGKSQSLDNEL